MPDGQSAKITNSSNMAQLIPRNLPRTKSARPTGFERTVSAVRPSISSATDLLAAQIAIKMANTLINVSPESLYILMSSPNVL